MTIKPETPTSSDSSNEHDVTPADSSTAPVETAAEATTAGDSETIHKWAEEAREEQAVTENSPPAKTEPEEAEPEPEAIKDEQAEEVEAKPVEDVLSQVESFDKRPEWQGLKKAVGDKWPEAKKALRGLFERETHLAEQNKALSESDKIVRQIRADTGDETGFNNFLTLTKQFVADPAASVPMLENLLRDARSRAGLEISSPDLKETDADIQQQLADGLITEAQAERQKRLLHEAERARAEANQAKGKVKATEQAEQQRQTKALMESREIALNDWEKDIAKRDPDFPRIKDLFLDRATMLVEEATAKKGSLLSPQEMVEQAEAAYKSVKTRLGGLLPKKQASRAVQGDRSSVTSRAESADPVEVAWAIAQAHQRR